VNSKSPAGVMRGYYLLDEFAKQTDGSLMIARRFWFDRVGVSACPPAAIRYKRRIESDIIYGRAT
jgi:hypothetical protein